MAQKTEAQQYAQNALDRVDAATAKGASQKMLDVRTVMFLQAIADGEQVVIPADDERLKGNDEES